MKIIVATTIPSFQYTEDQRMAKLLLEKLKEFGHQAVLVQFPFSQHGQNVMEQMLALRLQHIEIAADRLICLQAPSYLLRHSEKYLWLFNCPSCEDEDTAGSSRNFAMHEYVARADDLALSEARRTYAKSKKVLKGIPQIGNIVEAPLYPPLWHPEAFHYSAQGNYFYCSGTICSAQRQLLLIEAMKYVKTDARLVLAGDMASLSYSDKICAAIKQSNLEKKITLIASPISEKEKAKYYAECLAAIHIPSGVYCGIEGVLEAAYSEKAVLTCFDCDEIVELITNGINGFVVQPQPKQLAQALDALFINRALAEKTGQALCQQMREMDISWNNVIGRLTE